MVVLDEADRYDLLHAPSSFLYGLLHVLLHDLIVLLFDLIVQLYNLIVLLYNLLHVYYTICYMFPPHFYSFLFYYTRIKNKSYIEMCLTSV